VDDRDWLVEQFEQNRTHLRAVAYRMLGSRSVAEDAVQEVWLRLRRTDTSDVENLRGWLTTVVARVCLDMLRSRKSRREEPLDTDLLDPAARRDVAIGPAGAIGSAGAMSADGTNPEHETLMADSIGIALLAVLETLAPAERVAFVLHDMFDLPFDEIATIVGRSPAAARQLASRARRRMQGTDATTVAEVERARKQEVVAAFLAAARGGDLQALLAVLDPEVVVRADSGAVKFGAAPEVRGAMAVAETFKGRAAAAQLVLVDGAIGLMWAHGGRPLVVFDITIEEDRIVAITLLGDAARLATLTVEIVND
jgi:RNA polymerase sigma factor (sigma-70 family)